MSSLNLILYTIKRINAYVHRNRQRVFDTNVVCNVESRLNLREWKLTFFLYCDKMIMEPYKAE